MVHGFILINFLQVFFLESYWFAWKTLKGNWENPKQ